MASENTDLQRRFTESDTVSHKASNVCIVRPLR